MTFGYVPLRKPQWGGLTYAILRGLYTLGGWPDFLRRLQWPTLYRFLDLKPEMTVLDLGAGHLQYTVELAKRHEGRLFALDLQFSEEQQRIAERHGIETLLAEGESLPLPDASVDRILMSSVLHMVPSPDGLLRECARVLRKEGAIVLSVPNHYRFLETICDSPAAWARVLRGRFDLPARSQELRERLNRRFNVHGPQGYYTAAQLQQLVVDQGLKVEGYRIVPGWLGAFIWELGVLGYLRLGTKAFPLLFLAFPLARLLDPFLRIRRGGEHIMKVTHES